MTGITSGSGQWSRDEASGYVYPASLTDSVGIATNTPAGVFDVAYTKGAFDSYTKLVLHMDGSGTTFLDSVFPARQITPYVTATQTSAQSKFGNGSGYFSSNGDHLEIADDDSAFYLGNGSWTIDAWIYPTVLGGSARNYISQARNGSDNANRQFAIGVGSSEFSFYYTTTGADDHNITVSYSFNTGTWYHCAVVRSGGVLRFFVNGQQVGGDISHNVTYFNSTAPLTIGSFGTYYLNGYGYLDFKGYIDELRISKGIARWVSDFSPPASAYSFTPSLASAFTVASDGSVTFGGGAKHAITTVSASTSLDASYYTIIVDASSGDVTLSLPPVTTYPGQIYYIKKIDNSANIVTIDGSGAETIDGVLTQLLTTQYQKIVIQNNGISWYIVS